MTDDDLWDRTRRLDRELADLDAMHEASRTRAMAVTHCACGAEAMGAEDVCGHHYQTREQERRPWTTR